jgi:hypothetical protein
MADQLAGMGIHTEAHFEGSNGLRLLLRILGADRRLRDALAVLASEKIDQFVVQP